MLLNEVIFRLKENTAVISNAFGGRAKPPKPPKQPETAVDRLKRNLRQFKHTSLVSRVLPGRREEE